MKKILISLFFILIGCNSQSKNSNTNNKGIGPVSEVIFDEQINQNQAKSGEKMFNQL